MRAGRSGLEQTATDLNAPGVEQSPELEHDGLFLAVETRLLGCDPVDLLGGDHTGGETLKEQFANAHGHVRRFELTLPSTLLPAVTCNLSSCSILALAMQRSTAIFGPAFQPGMLTGSDLLAKVKELGDVSKSDLVRACGYVSSKKDGAERLNFTAFYEALLEAKGLSLGSGNGGGGGKAGRKLSYVATVQGNGNLLVGKAYTAMLGLQPGDEFEIKLGRKQIKLIPAGGEEE